MSTEKFKIVQDPSNSTNWGIIWESNGTQGGFTSEDAARKAAIKQEGIEASQNESAVWVW